MRLIYAHLTLFSARSPLNSMELQDHVTASSAVCPKRAETLDDTEPHIFPTGAEGDRNQAKWGGNVWSLCSKWHLMLQEVLLTCNILNIRPNQSEERAGVWYREPKIISQNITSAQFQMNNCCCFPAAFCCLAFSPFYPHVPGRLVRRVQLLLID